MFYNVH